MSRRDTIIVAILVNAGLLMVLFATALKSDDKKEKTATQLAKAPVIEQQEEEILQQYAIPSIPTLGTTKVAVKPEAPAVVIEEKKPAVVQAPKPATHTVNVTVKKGDFLEKIAKANNTTVSALMKENKMDSTQLKVGQVLRVPVSEKSATIAKQIGNEGEYYVVKDGDSPWLIATKNHVSLDDLLRINDLDEQKARRLRPGDRLRIR